jgi:hypothetical protein
MESRFNYRAFNLKWLSIFALMILLASIALPIARADGPQVINCPGQTNFYGTVEDQEGALLPGVVVYLNTPNGYQPYAYGSATTDVNGYWSITLASGCPANAQFWWQSDTNGPELSTVHLIPNGTTQIPNVWIEAQKTPVAYEYPHNSEVTIRVDVKNQLVLSADAHFDAGFSVGFLGIDAGGSTGTEITIGKDTSAWSSNPFEASFSSGEQIKIIDISGKQLEYLHQYQGSPLLGGTTGITDYLNMTWALNNGGQKVPVPANGGISASETISGVVSIDVQVGFSAFGFNLGAHAGVKNSVENTTDLTITNNYSHDQCFVVYQDGPDWHVWLYSNSAC